MSRVAFCAGSSLQVPGVTSPLGQSRQYGGRAATSGLTLSTDIVGMSCQVRFVPKATWKCKWPSIETALPSFVLDDARQIRKLVCQRGPTP